MTPFSRAGRALALLLAPLVLVQPLLAQQANTPPAQTAPAAPPVPAPKALQTGDTVPWLYRGSDVPVDDKWLFGEMKNGLRYAVRGNGVPPRQISIRARLVSGSIVPVEEIAPVPSRRTSKNDTCR